MRLLLASKSEARSAMLKAAGVPFAAVAAPLDEEVEKRRLREEGADSRSLALGLAEAKARSVETGAGDLVLGCDQTLELESGDTLHKPTSVEDAAEQLRRLSGRRHKLHAAAAICNGGDIAWSAVESVTLSVRPLGEAFIAAYLAVEYEQIRWCVGGYRIEGPGAQLFDRIEGSHFAILGLPLLPLLEYLREREVLAR